ncbi:MAG: class I SAM-dependent methyltransferase [Thiotrichaceae bacterium]|nr:class I SAM-dependent methyltransferase [Thiotrichaceae bacterium]
MQCKICGNAAENDYYEAKEMMLGYRDSHQYIQCKECECLQLVTIPDNLPEYYPNDDYYSYSNVGSETGLKKWLVSQRDHYAATGKGLIGKLLFQRNPEKKIATLQATSITSDQAILDVGCGTGHLLHSLKEAGFSHVQGADPFNEKDIEYDNGLKIIKQTIHDVVGQWDLIMFHHSFEHVVDQLETLQSVANRLKEGGTCLIRVPTVSSWAWKHYGTDWVQLDAPRHLFLHSIKSMETLAEQAGMQVDKVIYDSFALQFWGSEQYRQDIPLNDEKSFAVNPEKSPFTDENIADYSQRSIELNEKQQGDQVAFYLSKKR